MASVALFPLARAALAAAVSRSSLATTESRLSLATSISVLPTLGLSSSLYLSLSSTRRGRVNPL